MNERYKELARDAGLLVYNPEGVPTKLEKFAESIVSECGEVAYKAYWDNPETVKGIHIQEKIKEHFGVE
jgi:hypothetical protein